MKLYPNHSNHTPFILTLAFILVCIFTVRYLYQNNIPQKPDYSDKINAYNKYNDSLQTASNLRSDLLKNTKDSLVTTETIDTSGDTLVITTVIPSKPDIDPFETNSEKANSNLPPVNWQADEAPDNFSSLGTTLFWIFGIGAVVVLFFTLFFDYLKRREERQALATNPNLGIRSSDYTKVSLNQSKTTKSTDNEVNIPPKQEPITVPDHHEDDVVEEPSIEENTTDEANQVKEPVVAPDPPKERWKQKDLSFGEKIAWTFTSSEYKTIGNQIPRPRPNYSDVFAILLSAALEITIRLVLHYLQVTFPIPFTIILILFIAFPLAVWFRYSVIARWVIGLGVMLLLYIGLVIYQLYLYLLEAGDSGSSGGFSYNLVIMPLGGIILLFGIRRYLRSRKEKSILKAKAKTIKKVRILSDNIDKKDDSPTDTNINKLIQDAATVRQRVSLDIDFSIEEWWMHIDDLSRLGSIDLKEQDLDEFHPFLDHLPLCTKLKSLYLDHNLLEIIPDEVFELSQLQILSIQDNLLEEIHTNIGLLKKLTILNLSDNNINTFPSSILDKLNNLRLLVLTNNPISADEIERMRYLYPELTIEFKDNNSEGNVAPSITKQSEETKDKKESNDLEATLNDLDENIRYIDLHSHNLQTLPEDCFDRFNSISNLGLSYNKFKNIPKAIYHIPKLETLSLNHNKLKDIGDELLQLKQLKSLDISDNPLQKFPDVIGHLNTLETLEIGDLDLETIPEIILSLQNLKELSLCGNVLNDTNNWTKLQQFKNLDYLDLTFNELTEIPEAILQMDSLKTLDLSGNDIKELPEDIIHMKNLRNLILSYNKNIKLANHILFDLDQLSSITLNGLELKGLPSAIPNMTNLKDLWISHNPFEKMPNEIFEMTQLRSLAMKNCQLSQLPDKIGKLTNIEYLHLSDNKLKTLPYELSKLKQLKGLNLKNNPISKRDKLVLQNFLPHVKIIF
ncbi:MAG: leucine-rich repeat domain-containing protein [Saprospiraceae bacterium]|nr:leucine-rich repeat domain-containing protein [Saprospiraceae bacterium]